MLKIFTIQRYSPWKSQLSEHGWYCKPKSGLSGCVTCAGTHSLSFLICKMPEEAQGGGVHLQRTPGRVGRRLGQGRKG